MKKTTKIDMKILLNKDFLYSITLIKNHECHYFGIQMVFILLMTKKRTKKKFTEYNDYHDCGFLKWMTAFADMYEQDNSWLE